MHLKVIFLYLSLLFSLISLSSNHHQMNCALFIVLFFELLNVSINDSCTFCIPVAMTSIKTKTISCFFLYNLIFLLGVNTIISKLYVFLIIFYDFIQIFTHIFFGTS